ncbi:hypothetical protein FOPE_07702 [Fonsecaea pedrosoi]|nr:hypothetical protein FOPE_07702 [Fonsecaea pedrosoi]
MFWMGSISRASAHILVDLEPGSLLIVFTLKRSIPEAAQRLVPRQISRINVQGATRATSFPGVQIGCDQLNINDRKPLDSVKLEYLSGERHYSVEDSARSRKSM